MMPLAYNVAFLSVNFIFACGSNLRQYSVRNPELDRHALDGLEQHLQLLETVKKQYAEDIDLGSRINGSVFGNNVMFYPKVSTAAHVGSLIQPWEEATTTANTGGAAGRKMLAMRPVSMTVKCVMILTIESLCIYTGLSLLRNADELAARPKPSLATETFAAASRTSVFPAMLCMLFVGFRMYVLATTEGLGEPQWWAKACMAAATIGLTLQFVVVFSLPFLTKDASKDEAGKSLSALAGSHHDVHPILEPHDYHHPELGDYVEKSQYLSIVLLYGGVIGVLIGVCTYPAQTTTISPAVVCTCVMSATYFGVYFYLWCVRTYTEKKQASAEIAIEAAEQEYLQRETELLEELKAFGAGETPRDEVGDPASADRQQSEHVDPFTVPDEDDDEPKRELSESRLRQEERHKELLSHIDARQQALQEKTPRELLEDRYKLLAATEKARQEFVRQARAALLTKHDLALKGAAMNMSMSIKKAPMLAILFLAARMRALQVDPPYGMPPVWAQCCFVAITLALIVECGIAAYIGYTGKERRGYYGTYLYRSNPEAHIAQHVCAAVIYICLIPVVIAIFLMKYPGADAPAPISPTVKCVLYFELLYFGINIGQWCTFFAEDVLDMMDETIYLIQETFLAAGVSVTFAPMLCVLFVATRMRALQITSQLGNPPSWAQDCMFMCVFATCVQVFCCLLMPLFTGDKAEVDEDGNATFELNPMVGAYFVTVIKYIALFMLHGGVITVCVAVLVMTPEMCMEPAETVISVGKIAKMMAIFLVISCLGLLLSSAKVVGLAIKFALESCDEAVLGTTIEVKSAALSVLEGYVNVQGFIIKNPDVIEEDVKLPDVWSTSCLAKIDKLVLKINVWRIFKSLGKEFEITALEIKGLEFNYEKWSFYRSSNVDMILQKLNDQGLAPPDDENKEQTEQADAGLPEDIVIDIQEVSVSGISASGNLAGIPMVTKVADIEYKNFSEETGGAAGSVGAIVGILLKSILVSIVANFTNVGGGLIHGVEAVAMAPIHAVGYLFFGGGSDEPEEKSPKKKDSPSKQKDSPSKGS